MKLDEIECNWINLDGRDTEAACFRSIGRGWIGLAGRTIGRKCAGERRARAETSGPAGSSSLYKQPGGGGPSSFLARPGVVVIHITSLSPTHVYVDSGNPARLAGHEEHRGERREAEEGAKINIDVVRAGRTFDIDVH